MAVLDSALNGLKKMLRIGSGSVDIGLIQKQVNASNGRCCAWHTNISIGKCLPDIAEQGPCSPETAALRRRLGGGDTVNAISSSGAAVRTVGQQWITKRRLWYGAAAILVYVILLRVFGDGDTP